MGEASGALLGHPSTRQAPPRLSVILPTYNEAEGLGDVLDRIGVALADVPHEVVVVTTIRPTAPGVWRSAAPRATPASASCAAWASGASPPPSWRACAPRGASSSPSWTPTASTRPRRCRC